MCILKLPIIHVHAGSQSSHRYSKKHAIKQTSLHQRMQIEDKGKDLDRMCGLVSTDTHPVPKS